MGNFTSLFEQCKSILAKANTDKYSLLNEICELLQKKVSHYNWVGFYFANSQKQTLHLKAYSGIPTEHSVIPFGKGICGQVAVSNSPFLVDDVSAQDNYIACDINVKSELVVPLIVKGENIGQIDIDSNTINAFNTKDTVFLEQLNAAIADTLF